MTLEHKYRRLTRWFPRDWREQHEADLIATLMDNAQPGQRHPSIADRIDLVTSATKVRLRTRPSSQMSRRVSAASVAFLSLVLTVLIFRATSLDLSAEFLVTSLIVVVIPGTGVVYTVASAISGGWNRGAVAAFGCTLGIVPHLTAAVLGLSGIMQAGAVAFEAVRWIGVAFLVFMGVSMVRDGGSLNFEDTEPQSPQRSSWQVIRRGILLNLLNPKLTIFFFAFLPQFLDSAPRALDPRLIGLGAVFMAMTFGVFLVYAYASAAARERVLAAPKVLRWVQRTLGTLLVGFAVRLAVLDN